MGWADVLKVTLAFGVPVGLLPNSNRRKSSARTVNSLPSINFPSMQCLHSLRLPGQLLPGGVNASSCTTWIRSRNQRKSRIARVVSFGIKSRKEVVTSPVTAKSGTMDTPLFFSQDNWDSTSKVRILSTSSPKEINTIRIFEAKRKRR